MIYTLRIVESRPLYFRKNARLILIIGNFKDIQWFYSALSMSTTILRMTLMHLPSNHISSTTIQSIVCIYGKNSSEDFLQNLHIQNYECWPNNVLTVVRDKTRVPNLMKTHKIVVADKDEKWLSEVLRVIKRTVMEKTLDDPKRYLPHHGLAEVEEWGTGWRQQDTMEIRQVMKKTVDDPTRYLHHHGLAEVKEWGTRWRQQDTMDIHQGDGDDESGVDSGIA